MKKILLQNPGISSLNLGDEIISDSIKYEINEILKNNIVLDVSTHLPISYYYGRLFRNFDLKFVCGSNLLKSTFFGLKRQWDITLAKSILVKDSILIGVGWWQYKNKPNFYTKLLYKSILSKKYIHSVRDSFTEEKLKSLGITNVLNTACATMWRFNKEFCKQIPTQKSKNVVFTLTDYNRDHHLDQKFIEILEKEYENVYFWPQGHEDFDYLNDLKTSKLQILQPTLKSFDDLLLSDIDIEYIGTRLHGGIRAMQKKRRSIIIAIDNRALEKHKDFNIPIIKREDIEKLPELLNSSFETQITIPEENILKWKSQFK